MAEAFLTSTIAMAAQLLLASIGELFVERSGVINIGIEGVMLTAAFFAMAGAYFSGEPLVGIALAVGAAALLSAFLALMVVNLGVNQVVAGTALNIFALGLTGVAYRAFFGVTGKAFIVSALHPTKLGPLADIPWIGPALFNQNALVYAAFLAIPISWFVLFRTRWGLRLRAAGERPEAAEALGFSVFSIRWQALMISALMTGLSGAYLTLAYANTFVEGMSAGRGFVALAIVILGRWRPIGLAVSSILFGAAIAAQFGLQALGSAAPYQLFLALPYILTLVVLAIFGGGAQAPSGLGQRYLRA